MADGTPPSLDNARITEAPKPPKAPEAPKPVVGNGEKAAAGNISDGLKSGKDPDKILGDLASASREPDAQPTDISTTINSGEAAIDEATAMQILGSSRPATNAEKIAAATQHPKIADRWGWTQADLEELGQSLPAVEKTSNTEASTTEPQKPLDPEQAQIQPEKAQATEVITGTPAEGMDLDPRYESIRQELYQKWEERHPGQDMFSFAGQNYQLGNVEHPEAPTVRSDADRLFRERFPEDAQQYDAKEIVRIYESPVSDPAVTATESQLNKDIDSDPRVKAALKASTHRSGEEPWDIRRDVASYKSLTAWDKFVEKYPDKAKAYADRNQDIRRALERQEIAKAGTAPGTTGVPGQTEQATSGAQSVDTAKLMKSVELYADSALRKDILPAALQNYIDYAIQNGVSPDAIEKVLAARGIPRVRPGEQTFALNVQKPLGPEQTQAFLDEISLQAGLGPDHTKKIRVLPETVAEAIAKGVPRDKIKAVLDTAGIPYSDQSTSQTEPVQKNTVEQKGQPLTEERIKELANNARWKEREYKEADAEAFFSHQPDNTPTTLMLERYELPDAIGRRFDAHGIAKGGYGDQLRHLTAFLDKGIDPSKPFYTADLRRSDENEIVAAIGAGGPYDNGGFIIIGEPRRLDQPIGSNAIFKTGIAGVLVNREWNEAVPDLQRAYPNIRFIRADQMATQLTSWVEEVDRK